MIRVLIVDDQEMIRVGLRVIIEAQPDLTVVSEVGDGLAALRFLESTPVDVVLLDLRMPGIDGVETTRRIRGSHAPADLRIMVLTTFEHDDNVLAALRAGANGFLGKGIGPTELAAGIREVAAGRGALSGGADGGLIGHLADDTEIPIDGAMLDRFSALTPREREVVAAIASGLDNKQIAELLFVSPFTVKTHANRAMTKVGARDRAQLVSFAFRAGMRPDPET
jgi:DNA-binding NarL/FixJ family response regulator